VATFRLLTYASESGPRAGLLIDEVVLDLQEVLEAQLGSSRQGSGFNGGSVLEVLESWDTAYPVLRQAADSFGVGREGGSSTFGQPLTATTLLAPLLYPGAIYCAAANYVDHMYEMSGREPPDKSRARPYFFLKSPRQTVIGPNEPIWLPRTSSQIDWEAEIGVVIGRTAHDVSLDQAMNCVAGYTIVNDLSARDLNRREDWTFGMDWFRGKSFDGSAPMGPWITPAEAIPDPHNLVIQLWVNDQLMQDSSSRQMHFNIPEQIQYLSEQLTLRAGDVISTGTPAGVGRPRGIYLKPGDEVTITIEGLGTLRNRVEGP
jgi:2-keto-4-pentenoate hydratase/2-oxohepta-3-ene-1,7-dioic acid hydratase in catechol pathway